MTDLRFVVLQLIRGRGPARVRSIFMLMGVALAVVAALSVLAVATALGRADDREAARAPVGREGGPGFHYYASTELVDGRLWRRVVVTDVSPTSPLPPGLSAWPRPGQAVVSPRLVETLERSGRRDSLREVVVGRVGADGLRGPDELLSYSVSTLRGGSNVGVSGFGDTQAEHASLSGAVITEIAVLVGGSELFFLTVALRLSYTARRGRTSSLALIGVDPGRLRRMFAMEMTLMTVLGAVLGTATFVLAEPAVGASGILGTRWFPGDGAPSAEHVVLGLGIQAASTWWLSMVAIRSASRTPGTRRVSRVLAHTVSKPSAMVGILMWVVTLSVTATLAVRAGMLPPGQRVLPENIYVPLALVLLSAMTIGAALSFTPALRGAASVAMRCRSAGVRLGARIIDQRYAAFAPLGAAVAVAILLGGLSSAFLVGLRNDGLGDLSRVAVNVELAGLSHADRENMRRIDNSPRVVSVASDVIGDPATSGTPTVIHVAECSAFLAALDNRPGPAGCTGQPVQAVGDINDPGALRPGTHLTVAMRSGEPVSVVVPSVHLNHFVSGGILLPPDEAAWIFEARYSTVTYLASVLDGSYDHLLTTIHSRVPAASPQSQFKDPAALATYYTQRSVMVTGILVGACLVLMALVLTLFDLRWESARTRAAQLAIGVPRTQQIWASATQVFLPVLVGVVFAAPATMLLGSYFTSYWGSDQAWPADVRRSVSALVGLALFVCVAGVGVLAAGRLALADLLDE